LKRFVNELTAQMTKERLPKEFLNTSTWKVTELLDEGKTAKRIFKHFDLEGYGTVGPH